MAVDNGIVDRTDRILALVQQRGGQFRGKNGETAIYRSAKELFQVKEISPGRSRLFITKTCAC